jgi:VWFA-related protein
MSRRIRAGWGAVALAVVWLDAFPSAAQSAPEQQPTFRSGVGLVRVDVTVVGRDGTTVADLDVDDFEIREDGDPQAVQFVQFHRLTGRPADDTTSLEIRSPEHARQEAAREDVRLLVIFIDDYHLRYGANHDHELKQGLWRFLSREIRPTDLIAVMDPLTPLSDLELTRDRRELQERISRVQGRLGGFVPPRSPMEEAQLSMGAGNLRRIRAQISLSALESLVVFLGGLREGRKSVLFVSQSPPVTSMDFGDLDDVIVAANRANVTIHTLDPRGLGESPMVGGVVNESLVAETGGRRISQSNDFASRLGVVMDDASAYYLVGYTPTREVADGKFHEIDVRVRRRGVRVLARRGYWAPSAEELEPTPAPAVSPEITAAMAVLSRGARAERLVASLSASPVTGGRSGVVLACETVATVAAEERVDHVRVTITGPDGARRQLLADRGEPPSRWIATFDAPPGTTTVTVTAEDASGEVVEQLTRKVEVPPADAADAAIGTPLVYRPSTPAAHRAIAAGGDAIPSAVRRFRRTERVLVRLPVADAVVVSEVRAELVNGLGEFLTDLPMSRLPGALPQLELPLGSLALAQYLVRLSVTVDGQVASQLVSFEVIP